MDIFERETPFNIFSLHLNKQECTEVQTNSQKIIDLLKDKEYLSEPETAALELATNTLRGAKSVQVTIDTHLSKFLT